jgi:trehalose 6-phosphate phosphatase
VRNAPPVRQRHSLLTATYIANGSVRYYRVVEHLLTIAGLAALRDFDRARSLIALDFDGTLAPLVDDPDAARMDEAVIAPIIRLAATRQVVVISGRSLADLEPRVPIARVEFVGNHGIENGPGWPVTGASYRAVSARWLEALTQAGLTMQVGGPRWVEYKTYSLTIHYRNSTAGDANITAIESLIAALDPAPRVIPGRDLFNLVPHGAPSKGDALIRFARDRGLDRAIFVGDDHTDEDAFSVPGLDVFAVRVGRTRASLAPYFVHTTKEVGALLHAIADAT